MNGVEVEDVTCKHETDAAILVEVDGDEEWVPKSQILEESEVQGDGDQGTLIVSKFIAKKHGWD